MRQNFRRDKFKKEEARKKKREEKRNKRAQKKDTPPELPLPDEVSPDAQIS